MEDPEVPEVPVVPWHLSIHVPETGEYASIAGLMFEHTRLMIRIVAFMSQLDILNFSPDLENRIDQSMLNDAKIQINAWKAVFYRIALSNPEIIRENILPAINDLGQALEDHINLCSNLSVAVRSRNTSITDKITKEIYESNSILIANPLAELIGSEDSGVKKLWINHVYSVVDYITSITEGFDAFNTKATQCIVNASITGYNLELLTRGGEDTGVDIIRRSTAYSKAPSEHAKEDFNAVF